MSVVALLLETLIAEPSVLSATLQALQYSMSFFDAEKSGSLTSNDISWRGDSALSDALDGASLAGGFYDGGNGMHTSYLIRKTKYIYASWQIVQRFQLHVQC